MKAGSYRENQLASERAKLSAHSGADVVIAIRAPRALGTSDAQPEFDRWLNADEEDIDNRNGKNTTRVALLTSKNPRSRHSRQNIHKDTKTHEEVQLRRRSGSFRRLSSEQVLQKACFISKFYAGVLLSSMCDHFDWRKYLTVRAHTRFLAFTNPEELQTLFSGRLVLDSLRFYARSAWTQSRSGTQRKRWRIVSVRPPTPGALPAQGRPERYGL